MSLAWFLPLPGSYAGVDVVGVYNFACSLREVLAKHPFLPHGCGLFSGSYFPSFSEGLSLRAKNVQSTRTTPARFPFLFGGTFIEGHRPNPHSRLLQRFPFLFGGTFIEGRTISPYRAILREFPFLFGGTFIEGSHKPGCFQSSDHYFPSFSEGLSLRAGRTNIRRRRTSNFPSFSEGLSLRVPRLRSRPRRVCPFPFLFGGTFIEGRWNLLSGLALEHFPSFSEGLSLRACSLGLRELLSGVFPFLFGGTFIEGIKVC